MEIVQVKTSELVPYERNAKEHPEKQIEHIANSIEAFGFRSPIVAWKDGTIINGHGRLLAAIRLGLEEVPVIYADDLTEEEANAFRLADNKTAESSWDELLLADELADLFDFGMERFGFDLFEEEETLSEVVEDDFTEEVESRAKLGDVWKLGNHRLICGDSTDMSVVDKLMGEEKADMVFTDPPWNVNYGAVGKGNAMGYKPRTIKNDFMGTEEFKDFMYSAFKAMNNASKDGAMTYVVMSAQEWGNMMLTLAQNDYHWSSTIIWNKDRLVLSRKDYHTKYEPIWYGWKDGESRLCPLKDRKQSDVWDFDRPTKSVEHPTMKPVPLVARAITNSSMKGDAVLDLFGGSGTTLIACEQLDRRCYMSELDPHYCDVIINRWEQYTGRTAELIS